MQILPHLKKLTVFRTLQGPSRFHNAELFVQQELAGVSLLRQTKSSCVFHRRWEWVSQHRTRFCHLTAAEVCFENTIFLLCFTRLRMISGNYFPLKYHMYFAYMQKCISNLDPVPSSSQGANGSQDTPPHAHWPTTKPLVLADVAGSSMCSELQIPPYAATSKQL